MGSGTPSTSAESSPFRSRRLRRSFCHCWTFYPALTDTTSIGGIDCHPESVRRLREIIAMGGVFFQAGNRSQVAEFNVHSDPDAARRVVEFCRGDGSPQKRTAASEVPLTFVGLDVTHQVRFHQNKYRQTTGVCYKVDAPRFEQLFQRRVLGG